MIQKKSTAPYGGVKLAFDGPLPPNVREWHYKVLENFREYRGKIYDIGICVREIDGKRMVAVGEVLSRDKNGCNPSRLICGSVTEAFSYVNGLGRKER